MYKKMVREYINMHPYQVVEKGDYEVYHWDGTLENCEWWLAESEVLEEMGVSKDSVIIEPTSPEYAMMALGYGFEVITGKVTPDMYC